MEKIQRTQIFFDKGRKERKEATPYTWDELVEKGLVAAEIERLPSLSSEGHGAIASAITQGEEEPQLITPSIKEEPPHGDHQ